MRIGCARISYGSSSGSWQVSLNARYIGDEDEAVYHIPTGLGFGEDAVQPARWYSAELLYRFD